MLGNHVYFIFMLLFQCRFSNSLKILFNNCFEFFTSFDMLWYWRYLSFHGLRLHSLFSYYFFRISSNMMFLSWDLNWFIMLVPTINFWFCISKLLWLSRGQWSCNFFWFILFGKCSSQRFFTFCFFRWRLEAMLRRSWLSLHLMLLILRLSQVRLPLLSSSFSFWSSLISTCILFDWVSWIIYFLSFQELCLRLNIFSWAAWLVIIS